MVDKRRFALWQPSSQLRHTNVFNFKVTRLIRSLNSADTALRTLDPVLGVFTGFFAFYLNETHPKTFREEGDRLTSLIQWKLDQRRHAALQNEDKDLNELIQQFNDSNNDTK